MNNDMNDINDYDVPVISIVLLHEAEVLEESVIVPLAIR
jgi:hypothetical protein